LTVGWRRPQGEKRQIGVHEQIALRSGVTLEKRSKMLWLVECGNKAIVAGRKRRREPPAFVTYSKLILKRSQSIPALSIWGAGLKNFRAFALDDNLRQRGSGQVLNDMLATTTAAVKKETYFCSFTAAVVSSLTFRKSSISKR
jgi:hypothetical protein